MDNWIPEQQQPENQRSALDFNNGMELDDLFVNYFGFFLSMRTSWNVANRQDVRQSSTHFYFEGLKGGWIFHYGLWLRIRALNLEEKKKNISIGQSRLFMKYLILLFSIVVWHSFMRLELTPSWI